MPGFDRSGPMSAGPMTGRGRGWCRRPVETMVPPALARGYGYGRGLGVRRGFGRGFGRGAGAVFGGDAYPPVAVGVAPQRSTEELDRLRANAEAMRNSLESIQRRIAELEKESGE